MKGKPTLLGLTLAWFMGLPLAGQQTVFNVPSADVLERGKVYLELDVTFRAVNPAATATPRFVVGVGGNIELGMNLGAFSTASGNVANVLPTIKWKAYTWQKARLSLIVGDTIVVPMRRTSFEAGNYAYMQIAKQFSNTRVAAGVYHFTPGVVAIEAKAGAQLSVEQTLSKRLSLAVDWYSGGNAVCYVTPGAIIKVGDRVTLYPAYQMGNRGLRSGNHQFLFEIGWNLN